MQNRKIIIRLVCLIMASYLCIHPCEASPKKLGEKNLPLEMELTDIDETKMDENVSYYCKVHCNGEYLVYLSKAKWEALWEKWERRYGSSIPMDESISNYRTHYRGPLCFRFNEAQWNSMWAKFSKGEVDSDIPQGDEESYHIPMPRIIGTSRMGPPSLVIGKTRKQIKDTVDPLYVTPSEPFNIYEYKGVRYYGVETVRPYILDTEKPTNIHILKAITGAKCNSIYYELKTIQTHCITIPKLLGHSDFKMNLDRDILKYSPRETGGVTLDKTKIKAHGIHYHAPLDEICFVQRCNEKWNAIWGEYGLKWGNEVKSDEDTTSYRNILSHKRLSNNKWHMMWQQWINEHGTELKRDENISNYRAHYRGLLPLHVSDTQWATIFKKHMPAYSEVTKAGEKQEGTYHMAMLARSGYSLMGLPPLVIGNIRAEIKDTVAPLYITPSEPHNTYEYKGVKIYSFRGILPFIIGQKNGINIHILKAITSTKCNSIYDELNKAKIHIHYITLPKLLPAYKSPW